MTLSIAAFSTTAKLSMIDNITTLIITTLNMSTLSIMTLSLTKISVLNYKNWHFVLHKCSKSAAMQSVIITNVVATLRLRTMTKFALRSAPVN